MSKKWVLPSLIMLISLPIVFADLSTSLTGVWNKIISFGRLDYLGVSDGSAVVAITRILIWIMIFTVFFGVMATFVGEGGGRRNLFNFLTRGQAGVVAAVIATISAIFMPAEVLLAMGTGWATAIALILIGGPIVGIGYIMLNLTRWVNRRGRTRGRETRWTILIKLILCALLFWILSAMKYHVAKLAGGGVVL